MEKKRKIFARAVRYSTPVLLGYAAIGAAFGLLLVDAGYTWYFSLIMSVVMYAGAGQYIAVGLFASGAGLAECAAVQFIVNARHIAYGMTLLKHFKTAGKFKYYLIFSLTDETFALLSSLPETDEPREDRTLFMFFVALLDQSYWVIGSVLGALAGSFLPFKTEGVGFALTALFIVLLIEQILRVKKTAIFVISALFAVLTVFLFPVRLSLLAGMAISLAAVQIFSQLSLRKKGVFK